MTYTHPLAGHPDAKRLRAAAGDYVRILREARSLTQLEIATAVGFKFYTMVSQVESGKARVPPDKISAWARAVGADQRAFAKRMLMYYDPHTYDALFGEQQQG